MKPYVIHPFYFPTTVAFVDDSRPFLANLSLELDDDLAFRMYNSPFAALASLNAATPGPSLTERFFSLYQYREETSYAHHVVDLSLDLIHREMYDERRFEQVAVVVVDYDMPDIDGLEFFKNIRNRAVKKILLTGKANEQVAVKAFNERMIDRFIRKQEEDAITQLNRSIDELQQEYFRNVELTLSDTLAVGSHGFLHDTEFGSCFEAIKKQFNIVEHYLTCTPDGLLMLDLAGAAFLLLVQTRESLNASYEIAYDQGAPDELLEHLQSERFVPYFWKTDGNYSPIYRNWGDFLAPAIELQTARDCYFYAVVKRPAGYTTRHVRAYSDYLAHLDSESPRAALGSA